VFWQDFLDLADGFSSIDATSGHCEFTIFYLLALFAALGAQNQWPKIRS
jgi:hypothetical protein